MRMVACRARVMRPTFYYLTGMGSCALNRVAGSFCAFITGFHVLTTSALPNVALSLAPLLFRQLAAFIERHGWNWSQGDSETIPGVTPFTLTDQRAFGNQICQVPCGRCR